MKPKTNLHSILFDGGLTGTRKSSIPGAERTISSPWILGIIKAIFGTVRWLIKTFAESIIIHLLKFTLHKVRSIEEQNLEKQIYRSMTIGFSYAANPYFVMNADSTSSIPHDFIG